MIFKNQVRLSIKEKFKNLLTKKAEGGTHIFVFCMFILLFMVVLYRTLYDYQRMGITKDAIDDALITSMVSGCIYDRDEFASSGSAVVFRKVTPAVGENIGITPGGLVYIDDTPVDVINGSDVRSVYNPDGSLDSFLTKSYSSFEINLKKNLKLDPNMISKISGIRGEVHIDEFSIYNKYYNLDEDRNQTDFKFVKYTYNRYTGAWSVSEFTPNTYPTVYNSLTKANMQLVETSMVVKMSLDFVTTTYTGMLQSLGYTQDQTATNVWYQRIVDVKTGVVI